MGNEQTTEPVPDPFAPVEPPLGEKISTFFNSLTGDQNAQEQQNQNQQNQQSQLNQLSQMNQTQPRSNPNLAPQDTSGWGSSFQSKPKPVEEISGWISIKVIKGFNFNKKDNSKVEIGVAHATTNSWVDPTGVRTSKVVKASDQPQFGFDFTSNFKPKFQNIKIVFWCIDKPLVGKEKEYIIGTAKLDYQFFRSWYLSGQYEREKKVQLTNSSLEKDFKGQRHATLLIKWEGPSLAADKEGLGGPNANGINTQAWGGPVANINTQEIGKEFGNLLQETSDMLNEQIDEAMDFDMGGVARKGLY
jgi:hypothetical protein